MTEPDDLARAREELGEPERQFHINPAWFRGKLILGLLLVAGGLSLVGVFWALGWKGVHVLHWVIWPLVAGIGLLVNLYKQRGLFVLVYPTGLLRLQRGEVESYPWAEVAEVRLKTQRVDGLHLVLDADGEPVGCWLPAEVPDVQVWHAGLTVVREDGATAHFSPVLAEYAELAEEVQRRSFPHLWADAADGFRDGRMLPFGKLEVSLLGVHHAGKVLPWPQVGKLTIAQGQLAVEQKGKWLPWAAVKPAADIPNPHVLFALAAYATQGHPEPEPES
jgi:hypothetical protein